MKKNSGTTLTIIILLIALLLPACTTPTPQPVTFDAQGMKDYNGKSVIVDGFTTPITRERAEAALKQACTDALPALFDGNIRGNTCKIAIVLRYSMSDGSMNCAHAAIAYEALDKLTDNDLAKMKSLGIAVFPIPEEDSKIADAVCK